MKKVTKKFVRMEIKAYLCTAFGNNVWSIPTTSDQKEGWVSG